MMCFLPVRIVWQQWQLVEFSSMEMQQFASPRFTCSEWEDTHTESRFK